MNNEQLFTEDTKFDEKNLASVWTPLGRAGSSVFYGLIDFAFLPFQCPASYVLAKIEYKNLRLVNLKEICWEVSKLNILRRICETVHNLNPCRLYLFISSTVGYNGTIKGEL